METEVDYEQGSDLFESLRKYDNPLEDLNDAYESLKRIRLESEWDLVQDQFLVSRIQSNPLYLSKPEDFPKIEEEVELYERL